MGRPHRNIEIFSMSVLDMFASALGAFIICTVILFPSYNKRKEVRVELANAVVALDTKTKELVAAGQQDRQVRELVEQQESKLQQARLAQPILDKCKRELSACQVALAKTFLLVQIQWEQEVDVNLEVTDPDGREFSWRQPTVPGSEARLSAVTAGSRGVQVWFDPLASPGLYQIDYWVEDKNHQDVDVKGSLFDRYEKKTLQQRTIRNGTQRVHGGTIEISASRTLMLR